MEMRSIDEFEERFFPKHCKKFPHRMRLTDEEKALIEARRGGWRKK